MKEVKIEMKNKKNLILGTSLLVLFILWTLLVSVLDVKSIGPRNSSVGFASLNKWFHRLFGVSMTLYLITDWLGLIPVFIGVIFAIFGLVQWIKRKSILKVDKNLLVLGVFYIIVMFVYVFFEMFVVNYRPILIGGYLEASYPSSTTMLVMCVMPTAMIQLYYRMKNSFLKKFLNIITSVFISFMVIGRLLSGVHWLSDIIGGVLFSLGIVLIYCSICKKMLLKEQGKDF